MAEHHHDERGAAGDDEHPRGHDEHDQAPDDEHEHHHHEGPHDYVGAIAQYRAEKDCPSAVRTSHQCVSSW